MPAERRSSPFASLSITRRLTLLFASSTVGILALSAVISYWSLARSLRSEDASLLRENASLLQETLRRYRDRSSRLYDEIVFEPSITRAEPFFARVTGPGGSTLMETPGMADELPAELFERAQQVVVPWHGSSDHEFLLLASPVPDGSGRSVQVSLDVTHDALMLRGYGRVLATVLAFATLLATALGFVIARRGLRPIETISDTVQRVTAHRLGARLGGDDWPEELADLAAVFDQMLDRLEDSFARLSRFSADLAHELRTPLTNLRSQTEVALGRDRSPAEQREVLESSLEEYERLTDLIDRLLFLARADAGAAGLECESTDVRAEADAVIDFFAPLAEELGTSVEGRGHATYSLDPTLFRRALGNLLSNALSHTPRGGTISVDVQARDHAVVVSVTDTGSGIAPEHLPHVRDRFYRADPARSANGAAGAGLGLSLVDAVVGLHGGRMELASRPGEGTTVTLKFPEME